MCQTWYLDEVLNCCNMTHTTIPSMEGSLLTQMVFAILSILLGMLFAAANTDFRGSVFETQVGE